MRQVVGRLAGDQRGVVRDALVSEGVMEALLAIIQANAYSSSRTDQSGLALLCLADLAAGSARAKVGQGRKVSCQELIIIARYGEVVSCYLR